MECVRCKPQINNSVWDYSSGERKNVTLCETILWTSRRDMEIRIAPTKDKRLAMIINNTEVECSEYINFCPFCGRKL